MARKALAKARELVPDVLLTDMDMPHLNGLAVTEALHKELPQIKVLVLSTHTSTEFVLRCAQSRRPMAISSTVVPGGICAGDPTVHAGQSFFSPDVARVALNQFIRRQWARGPIPRS